MKYSNFNLTEVTGNSPLYWKFKATVDKKAGLFRNKTKTISIAKNFVGGWYFLETGEFCPSEINDLARAYEGSHGKDMQYITPEPMEQEESWTGNH